MSRWCRIESPLGTLLAIGDPDGLTTLRFVDEGEDPPPDTPPPWSAALKSNLEDYFAGRGVPWAVPVHPMGTPFQEAVWKSLQAIPRGETRSYQDVAEALGRPNATRAVARAIAMNPVNLLIPCHRVVGKNGSLTGYNAGLWRKRRLLDLERTGNR